MTWFIFLIVGFVVGFWAGRTLSMKEPKREKLLSLFNGGAEVFNDQVQTALGVSDATATRYLDQLEKEGVIRQVGSTGRGVVYKLK